MDELKQSVALDSVTDEFDAYYLPGGHGTAGVLVLSSTYRFCCSNSALDIRHVCDIDGGNKFFACLLAVDFPNNKKLQDLISSAWKNGKVVSSVCHGPIGAPADFPPSAVHSRSHLLCWHNGWH